jgi:polar amino acid transport system substrate-binding protein
MSALIWRTCVGIVLLGLLPVVALAQPLDTFYIEYPPYYHTLPDGRTAGLFADLTRKVFARADVEARFVSVPAQRILDEMRHGDTPLASLGWFKTPEREALVRFSRPLYVNQPVGVFFLRAKEEKFRRYTTLESLLQNRELSLGRVGGLSDGAYLDALLARHPDNVVEVAADSVRLLQMLKADRFDYLLLPPEEIETLLQAADMPAQDFVLQPMTDIPHGNARHIIYSKSVDERLIKRIDQAIEEELGALPSAQ